MMWSGIDIRHNALQFEQRHNYPPLTPPSEEIFTCSENRELKVRKRRVMEYISENNFS